MGRLTPKVRAAALTEPPSFRKVLTASTFSDDNAGGLPPVLPSAAARSHSSLDPVPDGVPLPFRQGEQHMKHQAGCGAVVAGVQPFCQGANVDVLVVKLLDRF